MKIYLLPAGFALVCLLSGCMTTYRTTAEYPPASPLGNKIQQYQPHMDEFNQETESAQPGEIINKLTLNNALSSALKNNPGLAAYLLEIRALEARALQAGLWPNPELEVEVENFAGNRELGGFDSSETTIMLSQDILLGNKTTKKSRIAALDIDLAAWDYETKRLEVFAEVKKAFIEVLAVQKEIELNEELLKIAVDFLANINKQIKAGKINPAEASRAKFVVSAIQIEMRSARLNLQTAKQQLAALWGSPSTNFNKAEGVLESLQKIPPLETIQALLQQNPALARYEKELDHKQAMIDLEKANALPDVNFGVGFRRFNESDDSAFLAAVSIPLPIRDRNQGGIAEANIRYTQTIRAFAALKTQLKAELMSAYNTLIKLHHEVTILKEEMLPDAKNAFETIKAGSMVGRFTMLDVLDAQRTLFEARSQYIRSITGFQIAKVEIELLVAQELTTLEQK